MGFYEPNKEKILVDMTGVQTGAFPRKGSRMDEYTFNKDSTRSPGQIYNVVDSREFSFRDKFKVNVESFGKKGTRFLPKRIELSPPLTSTW